LPNNHLTDKVNFMKKYYVAFAVLAAVMTACGGNDAKKEEKTTATTAAAPAATTDLSANPDYQKGLELVAKNDCLTCHKVSEKNIGPAYKDANISMLASKVIKGGQGVWGTVPMTPHPQLSEADAQQIIKYIFLLKK
jgi:cytochrome c